MTLLGAVFTIVVAGCMVVVVGDAARVHGIQFSDPAQMANDLRWFSGEAIAWRHCCLMMNAAVLGTTAIWV